MCGSDADRLETERLRPTPPPPSTLDELFRQLLDLIYGECLRAGMLRTKED